MAGPVPLPCQDRAVCVIPTIVGNDPFHGHEIRLSRQARGEAPCRIVLLEDGKPVTGAVLAGRILAQDSSLGFANETLRRFLQDEDQMTGSEIIRAIAVFLIEE